MQIAVADEGTSRSFSTELASGVLEISGAALAI